MKNTLALSALLTVLTLTGCKTAYYGAMETVGFAKRDILVNRVEDVVKVQEAAADTFQSALDRFGAVVKYDGGDLEKMYNQLSKDLKKSQAKADELNKQIAKVEQVSDDLIKEWKKEIKQYSDPNLKRSSQEQAAQTRKKTDALIASMKKSAASMDPVLVRFNDQVLFMKHNLNAQALAGVQGEAKKIENDVTALIASMEASIAEAEAFIREMK